jgi:ketosteroid isomerase-like protein
VTRTNDVVDLLREQDQAIDTAISTRDSAALEAALADDFIYTHSNGRSQPKGEFIEAIARREDPPRRLLSGVEVEPHGDIVVTRGDLDIQYYDSRPNIYMRYVRVYRQTSGGWLAFSHRTLYATDRKPAEG